MEYNEKIKSAKITKLFGEIMVCSDEEESNRIVGDFIKNGRAFALGRVGETECDVVVSYLMNSPGIKKIRNMRRSGKKLCNNAGFFPFSFRKAKMFSELYVSALNSSDLLAYIGWDNEERIFKEKTHPKAYVHSATVFEVDEYEKTWMKELTGKRVLIIHPFSELIKSQYSIYDKVFPEKAPLPPMNMITLKAVQTLGGKKDCRFRNWFEALYYMEQEIKRIDFDVALLGCGAYGMPLTAYIKALGKQAIYIGGSLQLLFGIMGARWENADWLSHYVNEYWTRPGKEDCFRGKNRVEGGCYW